MGSLATAFKNAYLNGSGPELAAVFTPIAPSDDRNRLRSFYQFSNAEYISKDLSYALFHGKSLKLPKAEQTAWVDIFVVYWEAIGEILQCEDRLPGGSVVTVFNAWKKVSNALIRGYSGSAGIPAWTLPCLYTVGKYLRAFAINADLEAASQGSAEFGFQDDIAADFEKNANLEEAARVINRMFTLCLSDRAPLEESRKWGIYNMTNLLFKTYFKPHRPISPPPEAFPKSHIVTFEYYVGVIHFLDENYTEAEEHLTWAWKMCHRDAIKNRELILTYLIPCHLVTTHTLPTKELLAPFPRLESLFRPLSNCIRKGDLVGFDQAMSAGEEEFVKRRIYLPLERGRDIALRNLFRKVFLAGGFDEPKEGQNAVRRTRVHVNEFAAALRVGTPTSGRSRIDIDEVECLLSNLIYKGLMKGYIARDRGIVVLSKGGAFPGTGV
ncbi:PCI/PINT associated module [Penicillium vulpinum]|uniref:PCI/PINT associated module n=1 Tax=Penicillium vulpinum TaxID=29845 RepID=UPI002549665B|nr:PCI/PINT associated module [Penicillium vulpinum]KAJ5964179.1 PCI/PINT associated module [Penicillium vulpinum]